MKKEDTDMNQVPVQEESAEAVQPVSEFELQKARLAEAQQAVDKAQEEIEASKQEFIRASQEITEAKKTLAAQKKQTKQAERKEKKQQRKDAITASRKERQAEFERRKQALVHTTAELSTKMKQLLSGDLESMQKREKTRGAATSATMPSSTVSVTSVPASHVITLFLPGITASPTSPDIVAGGGSEPPSPPFFPNESPTS